MLADADESFLARAGDERVAVCFSGWLNVSVPDSGATARRFLVRPLKADVLVAATYRAGENVTTLWQRLRFLRPDATRTAPMLTATELRASVLRAPAFAAVAAAFNESTTFDGLTVFSPVLGSRKASVRARAHARTVRARPRTAPQLAYSQPTHSTTPFPASPLVAATLPLSSHTTGAA